MKKTILIVLGLVIVAFLVFKNYNKPSETSAQNTEIASTEAHSESAEGIHFHQGTWQEALKKAKAENKLIFLDIYASWCGPCKMLKAQTFSDKKSGDFYNANFINVAQDGEIGEGIGLAEKFSIDAYPSLLFVNGDGELVSKALGFIPTDEFVKMGQTVLSQKK